MFAKKEPKRRAWITQTISGELRRENLPEHCLAASTGVTRSRAQQPKIYADAWVRSPLDPEQTLHSHEPLNTVTCPERDTIEGALHEPASFSVPLILIPPMLAWFRALGFRG